jgi:hypothetical protein
VSATTLSRLPGFRFEAQPLPVDDVLPRMDVAVFAGFSASGPVGVPVAVEDIAAFHSVFGDKCPLAWDAQRLDTVEGRLAPTVRAFFDHGGVRCWIIRLASEAEVAGFVVPGVKTITHKPDALTPALQFRVEDARALARSPGSWADRLEIATALAVETLEPSMPVKAGDLLRQRSVENDAETLHRYTISASLIAPCG